MGLLSSGELESLAFLLGMQVFSSFIILITTPIFFILLALILYYFSGDKKKADEFIPNLMAQSIRIFSYVWTFILSLIALVAGNMIVQPVLEQILPFPQGGIGRFAAKRPDFQEETFVQGLLMLALVVILIYGMVYLQRYSVKVSKIGGTISTKLFLTFGTVLFSILSIVSLFAGLVNFISYLYDTDNGLDSGLFSLLIVSVAGFGIYLSKAISTLKRESKK
ncbi:MAG: hypothetical protein Kow0081_1260 [Candidatus Dojkabacteria bacterium]